MAKTLAELKAAYASKDSSNTERSSNGYYPFWNMKVGESCTIRFLADKNDENPLGFLKEKLMHNLEINGEKKTVPCLKTYGENCPICKTSADFYKVEGDDSPNGKKYWRKKQYIAQALVLKDPLPADKDSGETHVGKVRFINLSFQIYNVIMEAFKGDELEEIPSAVEGGYDFIIKKTQQGKYDSYTVGTKFSKQRDLTDEEIEVANENSVDLETLLPRNPGFEKVQAMLDAALTGGTYSESKGTSDDEEEAPKPKAKPAAAKKPVVEDEEEEDVPVAKTPAKKPAPPKVEEETSEGDTDVDDMLATIRARRKAAQ